ncbi:MAG: sigma 54-interacting transcriptional regulator [Candidatus Aminicenantes bacterium]|nr:sigma 54-interacting transcriptional regulator [Candidatus Aminicenantes bacterium]
MEKQEKSFYPEKDDDFKVYARITEKISRLSDLTTTLRDILEILQPLAGCKHLAVRVIDKKGRIPFHATLGLNKKFVESEHWITLKDCFCGYVARGQVDKSLPFITEHGSFFSSAMGELENRLKAQHHDLLAKEYRGICTRSGFESLAIIPIRYKEKIIAELYLSDEKKGLFPEEKVEFLEKTGQPIGIAIENSRLYTELKTSQKRLMELFDSTAVGIIEFDTRGNIIQINQKGAELLGYSSSEKLLKQRLKMTELNLDPEKWKRLIEATDFGAARDREPIELKLGEGTRFLEFSLSPVKSEKGKILGYRGTIRNITDSVRLEEERINRAKTESLKNRYFAETIVLRDEIKAEYPFEEMIGISPAMQEVKRFIRQVAPTETNVLIKGETGTGKELVARYIHEMSRRKDRILVKVNCAALSEGLITSELFGHEKGAFTGAIERRIGRFEYADGATIFLDEIGDLPLETQAMLLRILQDGEFERVGSSKTLKVDVRVLAATNRDLSRLVEEKKFREDLLYRLDVFPITVAPLRERKEDIPLLAAYFLDITRKKVGKSVTRIHKETLDLFRDYDWPGNIRELQNIIEHGLVVSKDDYLEVPEGYFSSPSKKKTSRWVSLEEHESEYIREVLAKTKGVIYGPKGAARLLGLKPSTLQSRMKKLGIKR